MHNAEILTKVCCDVFEQLAFMFGESIDKDDVNCDSKSFIHVTMHFKGERSGSLEMLMPSELAESLACNILGVDDAESLDPGTPEDVVKEFLNTVCGRLLTDLYGNEAIFDLSVPSTTVIDDLQWKSDIANKKYSALDIEDIPVLVLLTEQ